MTLMYCRIITLLLLLICFFVPPFFIAYVLVMHISIEILNHNKKYLTQKHFKIINLTFIGYSILIFNRELNISNDPEIKEIINRIEHVLFAFVISLKVFQYLLITKLNRFNFYIKLLFCFLVFQLIGIINEVYQEIYRSDTLNIYFTEEAIHDIVTNAIGASFFVLFSIVIKKVQENKVELT